METIITSANIKEAACVIREQIMTSQPQVGLVLGSGLGSLAASLQDAVSVPYGNVPHMASSTAPGHEGCFVCGTLRGKQVICMQGRLHAYEGYRADEIAFPIYVMAELGIRKLIVTNAAGGIDEGFEVGDLMLIEDHVNLLAMNPCIGPEDVGIGPRFFDMTHAYDRELAMLAEEAAQQCGVVLRKGVYLATSGPSFETPAEIRAFRTFGASAVGMSTVLEVIAARQRGLSVLGLSLISNPAAGVCDTELDMGDVDRAARAAAVHMGLLIETIIGKVLLPQQPFNGI